MKALTANRLTDGEAVWYSGDGLWAETIDGAEIARDADGEARLEAIGNAAFMADTVLDVALIDVTLEDDGAIHPTRLRERIRAAGPTIHPNLGKQAHPATNHAEQDVRRN